MLAFDVRYPSLFSLAAAGLELVVSNHRESTHKIACIINDVKSKFDIQVRTHWKANSPNYFLSDRCCCHSVFLYFITTRKILYFSSSYAMEKSMFPPVLTSLIKSISTESQLCSWHLNSTMEEYLLTIEWARIRSSGKKENVSHHSPHCK